MKLMTRTRAGYLVTLAAGAAIGISTVGIAAATPGHPAPASHPVTHHYALAASAFAPDSLQDPSEDYYNLWDASTLSNKDGDRCFDAGLSLPPGARLKYVTFYYTQGTTSSIYFEINRQNLIAHTSRTLVHQSAGGTGSTSTKYTHAKKWFNSKYATVNMTYYAYSAGVCPLGDATFTGLIITYTTG